MQKRRQQKIKTVSYVHVGDKLVNTDDLNAEQKERLAVWIKMTYLNALYAGQVKFYPPNEQPKNAASENPGDL